MPRELDHTYYWQVAICSPPAILIVANSSNHAIKLKQRLEDSSCQVDLAGPGSSDLKIAHWKDFDLIVLILEQPGVDSFDMRQKFKTEPTLADIPVALLATCDRAQEIRAKERPVYCLSRDGCAGELLQIIQEINYLRSRYL